MTNGHSWLPANLIAALMALPAFVGALGVGVFEGRRLVESTAAIEASAVSQSMAAALESGEVEWVHALIRSGHDPSRPIVYRHPDLTGNVAITTTPLLIAVARHDENMVMTLLSSGAGGNAAHSRLAACLAAAIGHAALARSISETVGQPATECPSIAPGVAPLVPVSAAAGQSR
jgi:hypothetical protein